MLRGSAGAATSKMYQTIPDAIVFVICGLVAFWLLAAIFEAIGFTKHRYAARGIAALLTARWGMDRHGLHALVAGVDRNRFFLNPDIEEVFGQIGARFKMTSFSAVSFGRAAGRELI